MKTDTMCWFRREYLNSRSLRFKIQVLVPSALRMEDVQKSRQTPSLAPADDLGTVITCHIGVITWKGEGGGVGGERRERGEREGTGRVGEGGSGGG